SYPPFLVPDEIIDAWRRTVSRGRMEREAWEVRLAASGHGAAFQRAIDGESPDKVLTGLRAFRADHADKATKVATRKASEMALAVINAATDLTVGGSADLTGSSLTLTHGMEPIERD